MYDTSVSLDLKYTEKAVFFPIVDQLFSEERLGISVKFSLCFFGLVAIQQVDREVHNAT